MQAFSAVAEAFQVEAELHRLVFLLSMSQLGYQLQLEHDSFRPNKIFAI